MTLTIEAAPELMEAIAREAALAGLTPQEYTLKVLAEKTVTQNGHAVRALKPLSQAQNSDEQQRTAIRAEAKERRKRLSDLFAQWAREDATDDPEELARRQREGDEFMANIRANRFNIPQDPKLVALIEAMDG